MNLDELRTVQSNERQKGSLQQLRPSFYQEVGEYISNLEAERDRVADAADDPFASPEVGRLTDEIETARDVVEAVYERRMGKIVKQASLAAAGMDANADGLTAEEVDLFEDLVDRITTNKHRVLDVLEGADGEIDDAGVHETAPSSGSTSPSTPPEPETTPPEQHQPEPETTLPPESTDGVSAADAMGGALPDTPASDSDSGDSGSMATAHSSDHSATETPPPPPPPDEPEPVASPSTTVSEAAPQSRSASEQQSAQESTPDSEHSRSIQRSDIDRTTVRITQDIGSVLGIDDREYTLEANDVVTLPEQNATPLVEREAAEPLE